MQIKVVDFRKADAPKLFAESLKAIGFAVVSHHPINISLIDEAYKRWYQFFKSEEKYQYAFDSKKHDGYISMELSETAKGERVKDIKEFYHYYRWGRCPDSTKHITEQLFAALNDMANTLLQWVEANLPTTISEQLSMPLSDMIKQSPNTMLRLIHYPPLTGNEDPNALRAAAHEDINLLTLLPAATAKGLEVKNSQGHWLEVPCNPGWIIVNSGDMLQECTNHYCPATTHRVVNPTGATAKESRLSMPLFLHPNDTVKLSDRYSAKSFRLERLAELGLKE